MTDPGLAWRERKLCRRCGIEKHKRYFVDGLCCDCVAVLRLMGEAS